MNRFASLVGGLCALALSTVALASTPEAAATKLVQFLGKVPDLGPAYAVVVVTPDRVVLRHVSGEARAGTGHAADQDTPFYIASQTKAFVGLLASVLDEKGVLKLDSTLAEHWPGLELPAPVDASKWTLRDLLTHQVPIEAEYITYMAAYVDELSYRDYPALLAQHAKVRDPGFRYDNLGYNLYAAILQKETGRSWKQWLDSELLGPLAMRRTSTRSSDFPTDDLAWNHVWMGKEKGWHARAPKPDAIMQSAGGMLASVNDMAKWLQLQLNRRGPTGSGITATAVARAQALGVSTDPTAQNAYELPCHGYALGWNICKFQGHTLYVHGGSYTGSRSIMAFSPDLGVGIAVFSNSDNMTGWLTSRTVVQYMQYLVDDPEAERMAGVRQHAYPERVAKNLVQRETQIDGIRADAQWAGWRWKPDGRALAEYTGRYTSPDPRSDAVLTRTAKGLAITVHEYRVELEPAKKDLFGAQETPLAPPEPIPFERDGNGRISRFLWRGEAYIRAPD